MKTLLLPLATLATWAPLLAQSVVTSTNTPVGVYAANGAARDHQAIPALTLIGLPVGVNASVPGAGATTRLNPAPASGHGGIVIAETGGVQLVAAGNASAGTTATMPPAAVIPGPHSLLLRITNNGSSALRGRVVVSMDGQADANAGAGIAVDIGNDNTIEFAQGVDGSPHGADFPVVIANALAVKVTTDGKAGVAAAGRSGYVLNATVEFVPSPPPFQFTEYGQGCGDLHLSGNDTVVGNVHNVVFKQENGFPASPGALWLGDTQLNLHIPGIDCIVYTNVLVNVPMSSDALGNSILAFPVAAPVFGVCYAQGLSYTFTPFVRVRLSNGVKVVCNG